MSDDQERRRLAREARKAAQAARDGRLEVVCALLTDGTIIELAHGTHKSIWFSPYNIAEMLENESDFLHVGEHIIRKSLIARVWRDSAEPDQETPEH